MQSLSKRRDIACAVFLLFLCIRWASERLGKEVDYGSFLEVTMQHKKYHAGFMDKMRQQPEVTSCYQVEGEYDFLVKADVTSEKELEKLERGVRKINGI